MVNSITNRGFYPCLFKEALYIFSLANDQIHFRLSEKPKLKKRVPGGTRFYFKTEDHS
jgi:hypothetical protein